MMDFYVLSNPKAQVHKGLAITDFAKVEPVNRGDAPKCPQCGQYVGGLVWLPPYRAELEVWSNAYGDIAFGPSDELLVSERFASLYETSGLEGFEGFFEVEIVRVIRRGGSRLKEPPPKHYCVTATRSRAAIALEASGIVHEEPWTCFECKSATIKRGARIVLEDDTWQGEDVFIARGLPGTIITSKRFEQFFKKNRFNTGLLIPADQYSFDYYPGEHSNE